jgi:hypothetical protein
MILNMQLVQVLAYRGTEWSEMATQLETAGSGHPLIRPEPACGILERVPKQAMRE